MSSSTRNLLTPLSTGLVVAVLVASWGLSQGRGEEPLFWLGCAIAGAGVTVGLKLIAWARPFAR